MNKILTYLAIPYSHPDPTVREERFRLANIAAATLLNAGEQVFSPISHSHPIAEAGGLPTGFEYYEAFDMAILGICKNLVLLMIPGWSESKGVTAELEMARRLGIPCFAMRSADRPPNELL